MYKSFLLSLFLLFSSFAAVAQYQSDSAATKQKRFYVGVELSSISYLMSDYTAQVGGMFTPIGHVNVGYQLSRRANLQVGFTFGGSYDNFESINYKSADSTIYQSTKLSNRGVAVPFTLQYTPFNPSRRLNFYATASLVPVVGEVNRQQSETFHEETEVLFDAHDAGVYMIATAGIVLNYKISRRLEGYGKANLLYKDLGQYSYYAKRAKSVGVGLNYTLGLKK